MSETLSDVQKIRGKIVLRVSIGLVVLLAMVWGVAPISVPQVFAAGLSQEIREAEIDRAVMREEGDSLKAKLDWVNSRSNGEPGDSTDSLGRTCLADAERNLGHGVSGCDQGWMLTLLRW